MSGNIHRTIGPQREDIQTADHPRCSVASRRAMNIRMQPGNGSLFPLDTLYPQGRRYSPELAGLVARWLEWHAHDRPTLDEVQTQIDDFLDTYPHIRDDPRLPNWASGQVPDPFRIGERIVVISKAYWLTSRMVVTSAICNYHSLQRPHRDFLSPN